MSDAQEKVLIGNYLIEEGTDGNDYAPSVTPGKAYLGRNGNDIIRAQGTTFLTLGEVDYWIPSLLNGGKGDDQYRVDFGASAFIFDASASTADSLKILDYAQNIVGLFSIEDRHLFASTLDGTNVLVIDALSDSGRIETIEFLDLALSGSGNSLRSFLANYETLEDQTFEGLIAQDLLNPAVMGVSDANEVRKIIDSLLAFNSENIAGIIDSIKSDGPFQEGATLSASSISGDPDGNGTITGYQWFRNGTAISGGTAANYVVPPTGAGTYKVAITYSDGLGYKSTVESPEQVVSVFNNGNGTIGPIISSTIGGHGEHVTLTAPGVINDPDGDEQNPNYSYQWFKDGTVITNAIDSSYSVPLTVAGSYRVAVAYTDAQGFIAKIESEPITASGSSDQQLNIEWERTVGGGISEMATAVSIGPSGATAIAGFTSSFKGFDGQPYNGGSTDMFVSLFDESGKKLWTRLLGNTDSEYALSVHVDSLDNVYVLGRSHPSKPIIEAKISKIGLVEHEKRIAFSGNLIHAVRSEEGSIFATGVSEGDVIVAKYEDQGNIKWQARFGTKWEDRGYEVIGDNEGGVYVTGFTQGGLSGETNVSGIHDAFLSRLDSGGNLLWTRLIGEARRATGHMLAIGIDGGIYVGGFTTVSGREDFVIARYDTDGEQMWKRQYQVEGAEETARLVGAPSGGVLFVDGEKIILINEHGQDRVLVDRVSNDRRFNAIDISSYGTVVVAGYAIDDGYVASYRPLNRNNTPRGAVIIDGTATQGQALTANTSTIVDADGLGSNGFSYQWKADGADISGATASTFELTQDQVGKAITVVASYTDGQGTAESLTSAATAVIANINDVPTVATPIPDQNATEDAAFSFTVPADTFADVDAGDTLTLSTTLADGSALPAWLTFTPGTGVFSGTPANGDVGSITVKVTATDSANASVADEFIVLTANSNDAPETHLSISSQSIRAGSTIAIPINISDAAGVESLDLTLSYDPAVFSAPSTGSLITSGSLTPGASFVVNDTPPGQVSISWAGSIPITGGSGSIATLNLQVRADATPGASSVIDLISSSINENGISSQVVDGSITILPPTFQVKAIRAMPNGIALALPEAPYLDAFNLYDGPEDGVVDQPDLTLTGPNGESIALSAHWQASSSELLLLAANPLAPGDYTLSIDSRSDGLISASSSELLDGNGDGTPGDTYTTSFTHTAAEHSLSIGDTARGAGQALGVNGSGTHDPVTGQPIAAAAGLPIYLSTSAKLTSLSGSLSFDSSLFLADALTAGADLPDDWTLRVDPSSPSGQFLYSASGSTAITGHGLEILRFQATVAADAAPPERGTTGNGLYGSITLINATVASDQLTGTEISIDPGLVALAYAGDTTGNGTLSSLDASRVQRVVVGLDSGFEAYDSINPVMIGDTTGNGGLSSLDASRIQQQVVGLPVTSFPSIPDPLVG